MISVAIMINGNPITARSAVNEGQARGSKKIRYRLDDGSEILHCPQDGAVNLAIEMLKTIKAQKTHNEINVTEEGLHSLDSIIEEMKELGGEEELIRVRKIVKQLKKDGKLI